MSYEAKQIADVGKVFISEFVKAFFIPLIRDDPNPANFLNKDTLFANNINKKINEDLSFKENYGNILSKKDTLNLKVADKDTLKGLSEYAEKNDVDYLCVKDKEGQYYLVYGRQYAKKMNEAVKEWSKDSLEKSIDTNIDKPKPRKNLKEQIKDAQDRMQKAEQNKGRNPNRDRKKEMVIGR